MTKGELIQEVIDELSASCSLANKLNTSEIERIIKRAERWFFDNYEESLESRYLVLKKELFDTPEFTQYRTIQLPDCVESVFELKEIQGGSFLGTVDRDFSDTKLIGSEVFLSTSLGDNIVSLAARMHFFDLAKGFMLERVAHSWNHLTHKIMILGRNPYRDVFAQASVRIPLDRLYEDQFFIRYVVGKAKVALGNILGRYTYTLIGGVTVNYSDLVSQGTEEWKDVVQEIKDRSTGDFFYTFHSFIPPMLAICTFLLGSYNTIVNIT